MFIVIPVVAVSSSPVPEVVIFQVDIVPTPAVSEWAWPGSVMPWLCKPTARFSRLERAVPAVPAKYSRINNFFT